LLAFVLVGAGFGASLWFSAGQMQQIRDDLRLLHRGYLAMNRLTTQLRVLHEAKSEDVERALLDDNRRRQGSKRDYARAFYPRAMNDRLQQLTKLSTTLQQGDLPAEDKRFLAALHRTVQQCQTLLDADIQAAQALLAGPQVTPPQTPSPTVDDEVIETLPTDDADTDGVDGGVVDDGEIRVAASQRERDVRVARYRAAADAFAREIASLSSRMESKIARSILRAERNERDAMRNMLLLFVLSLGLGGVSWGWVQRGLRPLRQLQEVARNVSRGNLDVEVPVDATDELGTLAQAFNDMTHSLREREQTLASRSDDLLLLKQMSDDIIRSVRVGLIVLDDQRRVVALNPAARSMFQLPLVDVEDRVLTDMSPPQALQQVLDAIDGVLRDGQPQRFGLMSIGGRTVDVSLVPVQDVSGQTVHRVMILGDDVSERERTKEKLVESERLAAIGRLAAQITHEIRNPLSSVALNIELLGDDVPFLPDERQAEMRSILDAVGSEVDRLTSITEGYLRFARLPGTKLTDGDVGDALADLVAFSQKEAGNSGVMLELNVEEGLPKVPHDPARLRQALLNLLKNGMEAAGAGGTVRLSVKVHDDAHVMVIIEDSGPGFDDEMKANLFTPFFTTKDGGTGLGMTLAKEVIDEHGGTFDVDDSPLGGARLLMKLPSA